MLSNDVSLLNGMNIPPHPLADTHTLAVSRLNAGEWQGGRGRLLDTVPCTYTHLNHHLASYMRDLIRRFNSLEDFQSFQEVGQILGLLCDS